MPWPARSPACRAATIHSPHGADPAAIGCGARTSGGRMPQQPGLALAGGSPGAGVHAHDRVAVAPHLVRARWAPARDGWATRDRPAAGGPGGRPGPRGGLGAARSPLVHRHRIARPDRFARLIGCQIVECPSICYLGGWSRSTGPSGPSASSPPPRSSTATTPRSTSCGGSCSPRGPRWSTSATTARSTRSSPPRCRRTSQGVAVSSYQGGHIEYFGYLVESLRAAGAGARQGLRRRRRGDRRRRRSSSSTPRA